MALLTPVFILNGFRVLSCTTVFLRFKYIVVIGEFFLDDGILLFEYFSAVESECVDILPLGMGFLFPEVCHYGV